jgi:bacteriorhodopsin
MIAGAMCAFRVDGTFRQSAYTRGMDWLTMLPQIVGAIGNLSALAMQMIAECLLIMLLAAVLIGGAGAVAVAAFAWLWLKRAIGELHPHPSTAPR